METTSLPVLILCGGESRRMGTPKPLLEYRGKTLIAAQVADALPRRAVWLAAGTARYAGTDGATYFADALPGRQGALSAVLPALQHARRANYTGIYVFSCDTLLLPETLIAYLQTAFRQPEDYARTLYPASPTHSYPLTAYWSCADAGALENYLAQGHRRIMPWLAACGARTLAAPPPWEGLLNLNTPQDFARAQKLLENAD